MATKPSRAKRWVTSRMCALTPKASWKTSKPGIEPPSTGRAVQACMVVPSDTLSSTYSLRISILNLLRGLGFSPLAFEEFLLVDVAVYGDIKEADHHFVMSLVAPPNGTVGIRIVRIVFRIVVPRDGLELRSRFQEHRFGEFVAHLPVEVIVHAKKCLD